MKKLATRIALLATMLFVVACGGGSSGSDLSAAPDAPNTPNTPDIPDTPDTPSNPTPPYDDIGANSQAGQNLIGGLLDGLGDPAPMLGNTSQAVVDECMSDIDQAMLTQLNIARSQGRMCGNENYPVANPVSWSCALESVALEHSRDMGDINFFSHTGSNGLEVSHRVTNAGYVWNAVGENIAAGQRTLAAVMDGWLDSPGHCSNIMSPAYTEFGAGVYFVDGSIYPLYWTQVFARPRN
jgi:uncharacterized protein YkwD